MSDAAETESAVLTANRAFYRAFAAGDFGLMDILWSHRAPVACVHPGWPPVRGREKVMETWRGILSHPPTPPIRSVEPVATVHGAFAYVICFEVIGELYLVATNLFVLEEGAWKLVHHQSGQTERRPGSEPERGDRTIH
jgi:ketosteroid isomerase-like protein